MGHDTFDRAIKNIRYEINNNGRKEVLKVEYNDAHK